jgi:hypothetical protein
MLKQRPRGLRRSNDCTVTGGAAISSAVSAWA